MTSLIKLWELPGGIHPPQNKAQSLALPLGQIPLPTQLILPLNQHIGAPAKPVVQVGDQVLTGQLIAAADGTFSANVHASSSGRIVTIAPHAIPHASGMASECIVIETDGRDEWIERQECSDYLVLDRLELLAKIRAAGVAGLGGAGFPTDIKLAPKSTQVIDTLIINGAECEPYITADDILMQVNARELLEGTLLISHILHHPRQLLVGVEDNKPKAIAALKEALLELRLNRAEAANIQVVAIPTKYPSGGAKQLTQILTGREIPSGHHSADVGVICVNVGTAVAAWRAVRYGEPLISRITTLVGEALDTQRNIEVRLGTPIDYVLQVHGFDARKGSRVIMGGPMMGFTLPDLRAPIIKTTNCLLAPSDTEMPLPPPAQACIRCGLCAEACPVDLLPQQLFWYAQAEDFERLESHNLFDCIECGACAYVCPSSIPLVQYYRAAKGSIHLQELEKEKSDRSRQRFEFRKARIAKEEAEKEAKRLARQKAAEEAKKKLAEKASSEPATAAPATDVVSAAVAKASAAQPSPEEQKAKFERLLAAAKNGLEFAQKPLVVNEAGAEISEEQLEKQKARIKQAELKVAEAEKKLAEFIANQASAPAPVPNTAAADPNDPVAAAIARAQAKLAMPPGEKAKANLESLRARLAKAQEKADAAKAEGSATADALQQGVEKLQQKVAEAEAELKALGLETAPAATPASVTPEAPANAEQNAAQAAIEKAKAKAAALANMSEAEKRIEQVQSLKTRLEKARERLAKAEAEGDANIEAFRTGVSKLEEKLKEVEDTTA
ncbi:electron transport complex subunit RsxC [Cellvibrio japonicus]|uniref:Ion-translocating oxidoreductase complex subunit C n=1 Tax=Cellvibrio japonicus (strain Ueda107) TaxID=498211 RepID=B3PB34_CELJU|nr:electron transport complex subunit RsxC [Cellvibrio japonicus]ACE86219.1 Electron transport complex protein RnfC [Cellvibrio japonicus Ueda107]QEI11627.1 electron transport complex subunit RsxC [Cellvibrio japonicus]QEI15201.1 electron transport complex subunit RsxC [Cellvibrio japonicus]QEI18781.1 electron transport complex subunit RsxC [Cellvibrio japonicus]